MECPEGGGVLLISPVYLDGSFLEQLTVKWLWILIWLWIFIIYKLIYRVRLEVSNVMAVRYGGN